MRDLNCTLGLPEAITSGRCQCGTPMMMGTGIT